MMITAALIYIISSFTSGQSYAASGGELSFTVRTVSANGNFAPRHVLAIWIEDLNGFVKSRKVMANQRKQYLYTWVGASNYNVVDAITGPTLNSHQTHSITWDCTDLNGNIVPDGDYVVWAEFTEMHGQGPLYSAVFTKGPDAQLLTPPDEPYFKDIVISFTPLISDFSADITEVCQSGAVVFTDGSVNATSWEWDFGEDAVPATASTQGPHTVHYAYPGPNNVSLTINGSVTEVKDDYIHVATAPLADFMYSGQGMAVDFMNTSTNALSYSWDFGDGNTSSEEHPTHVYSSAGIYLVSLDAVNDNCHDTQSIEVSVPLVGIDESAEIQGVRIFPNPNNGIFYVESDPGTDIQLIRLADLSGRYLKAVYASPRQNKTMIDAKAMRPGIYYVEIIAGTSVIVKSIIIH